MSLPVTKLDTIDFEKLVEDARGLIPRFAPEWTDHNLHDPGITLIELLAWITDQEIYRVGFVGDRHLKAFAALLGVHERKAEPAHGLVWPPPFGVKGEPNKNPFVSVAPIELERNTRVVSVGQPDIPFIIEFPNGSTAETRMLISDARPQRVQAVAGATRVAANYLGERADGIYVPDIARDAAAQQIELSFDRPIVPPPASQDDGLVRLVALGIAVKPEIRGVRADDAKGWGPIAFDYRVGTGDWQPVDIAWDGTLALARTGAVLLRIPPGAGTSSVLRLRLDRGFFPIAPKLTSLALNALPIVQLDTIKASTLTRSNGLPDQVVSLDISNLPEPGSEILPLVISTEEANTPVEWSPVVDFTRSGPGDSHYVVDTSHKRLRFGNGINGRIPPLDAAIRHGSFHVTQGSAGNLGAGLKWRLAGSPGEFGRNLEPTGGGSDTLTVQNLVAQARDRAVRREVLLTNDDLKDAAKNLPGFGIERADVVVRHDPSVPDRPIRGTRTLVVVPSRNPSTRPPGPVPAQYLDAIGQALAPRRLLGERLSIEGPRYVNVDIALRILIASGAGAEVVRRDIERSIRARLSDLRSADDISPWPLGRPVTAGEIKGIAARVKGVVAVRSCGLAPSGSGPTELEIQLERTGIAIANGIDIKVEPETIGGA